MAAASEKCARCSRIGLSSIVKSRKKRKDAVKRGRHAGANALNIHTRPVRRVQPVIRLGAAAPADLIDDEDEDDGGVMVMDEGPEEEYLPAPEFSPDLRYSAGGSFLMMRQVVQPTAARFIPWTGVGASAGAARNTNAQFGGTRAHDHGMHYVPGYAGYATPFGNAFEWCHFMADSLGGATSQANLFCGTFHANTAMLCIENVLRGKAGFEVQVLVDVKAGSFVSERIVYRIRKRQGMIPPVAPVAMFEEVIDGLATGCTKADGEALGGKTRAWIRAHR